MSLLESIDPSYRKVLRPSGGCHNCRLKKIDFVPPTLKQTKIIWLGESPGKTDVEAQEGFAGKGGEKLRHFAKAAGIQEFSTTHTIHCRPPDDEPKEKEIACCLSEFVIDEIKSYPIVAMMGSVPLRALFPGAKGTHYRGNIAWHPDFPGQRFYAMYNPGYLIQYPKYEAAFEQDMNRLGRIVAGEPPVPWKVHQGGTDEMWRWFKDMLSRPLLSFDFETTDIKTWLASTKPRSLALTADGKNVVWASDQDPHWTTILQGLRGYLEQEEKGVVGNNIGFDLDIAAHEMDFTIRATGIHEISVIWYQAGQYKQPSLKELVARELDGYRYLVYEPNLEQDMNLLANYNAEDVVYPIQLFWKGMNRIKPKTQDLVTRVLGPVSLCLHQTSDAGFYLRRAYRDKKIEEYEERRMTALKAWHAEDPEFLIGHHESGKGLDTYLYTIRKLPILSRTAKDKASTDQEVIKTWVRDGWSQGKHLLDVRECDKILSTYLRAYDKWLGPDSRIHSHYPLTYTDSGRSSSRSPNLQNIPRVGEIRDLFGCSPGGTLLEFDLSQIEFRIMVCLSKDPTGIAAYQKGDDAHTTTARSFAVDPLKPTKEERSRAKIPNFMLIYGGSAEALQAAAFNEFGLSWSIELCETFRTQFFGTYKSFPLFHADSKRRLEQNRGWFESVLGHVFYYEDWKHGDKGKQDHAYRAALNSECQGPAAQICFAIMVQTRRLLDARGLTRNKVAFVNTVHDSILFDAVAGVDPQVIIDTVHEAVGIVYEWVRSWFIVPLLMDAKIGESWGSLKDVK